MKTILHAALITLLAIFTVANFTGCSSPPRTREAVVFDNCKATYNVAREAYKATVKLHLVGKLNDEQRKQADDLWNVYRESFKFTMRSLTINWSSATPGELQALTQDFISLLKYL